MGYRRERRVLHLVYAGDSAYAGLEVQVRAMSIGDYYAFLRMAHSGELDDQEKMLAEHLLAWNVEDEDGKPVPATLDGILSQETDIIRAIKRSWIDNTAAIPDGDPLALSSTSGLPAALLDLPTEPLAGDPVST